MAEQEEQQTVYQRDDPNASEARKALVEQWAQDIRAAKEHWKPQFDKMREDQRFAAGEQWPKGQQEKYTANVVLRHIQQRVAALYAKNPKAVARRRERIYAQFWDGTQQSLMQAQQVMMAAQEGLIADEAQFAQAQMILQEAEQVRQTRAHIDKIAKTLELLYQYQIDEQVHPFKTMMKQVVRRSVTTGVGYVKLGFQRLMERSPETDRALADVAERLSRIERLAGDMADAEIDENEASAEDLRLQMQSLEENPDMIVVREGLSFDYPKATAVVPDKRCTNIREFLGCDWVAEEYLLDVSQVQEIYGVDVKSHFRAYQMQPSENDIAAEAVAVMERNEKGERSNGKAMVWEVYQKSSGMVYVVCDGYPDFLREPSTPDVWTERFWPWYPLVMNETEQENNPFPPSDVSLIRDMQQELNRSRQGLREHRRAARPKTVVAAGMIDEDDKAKLMNHPANAVIELSGLQPNQSVEALLQAFRGPAIDPNLYEVNPVYEDILRVVGVQEANLGGTAGGTATESSIAESSRMSAISSNIDDLDDLLTNLARNAGQILLAEVSGEVVKKVVGPGAIWPEMSRQELAEEILLEIEAGSTGRPNQAQEVQNAERLFPLLLQIPGISPEWLAKQLIQRLDDRLDLTQAFMHGLPSVTQMNQRNQASGGENDPRQQGGEGSRNTETPQRPGGEPTPQAPEIGDRSVN